MDGDGLSDHLEAGIRARGYEIWESEGRLVAVQHGERGRAWRTSGMRVFARMTSRAGIRD